MFSGALEVELLQLLHSGALSNHVSKAMRVHVR